MTYQRIVNAKRALNEISKMRFPISVAYKFYKLGKRVNEIFEFEVEQEKQLVEKYSGEIGDDGSVKFDESEQFSAFNEDIHVLLDTEIEEEIEPVDIEVNALDDISVSPETLSRLEGFVNFL